jgi:CBS domain-containing protein
MRRVIRRLAEAAHLPIATIMTREVVCVCEDLGVPTFLERGLHGAPVLDSDGELVGFISMADIVEAGFAAEDIAHATVRDLMMPTAISLEETAPISMAAALMSFEGVHRLPVVSHRGRVVGILSALDVMRWLAREDGYEPNASCRRVIEAS